MKDIWTITKSLTNTLPPFIINGKTATKIQEELNAFADTSEKVFTTNFDVDSTFAITNELAASDFLKQPITVRVRATNHIDTAWIFRCLKPRKAPGPDGIQNMFPNLLPKYLADHLRYVIFLHDGKRLK